MYRVRTRCNRLAMARAFAPVLQLALPCSDAPANRWALRHQCQLGGHALWPQHAQTWPQLLRRISLGHERSTTDVWKTAAATRSHRRVRSMATLQAVWRVGAGCHKTTVVMQRALPSELMDAAMLHTAWACRS